MRLYLKSFFAAPGFWLFWVYLVPCCIFRTQRWTFSLSTAASTSGRPGSVSLNHLHTTTSMTWTGDGLIHLKERKEHAVIQPSTAGADRTSTAPQLTVDPRLFHQDGAAEAAANVFLRSDVPAPVLRQEEHQPLGFVLLLLRKQVELGLICLVDN